MVKFVKLRLYGHHEEAIITAAKDQASRINRIKHAIDKRDVSPKCGICQAEDESAIYIPRSCGDLAKLRLKCRNENALGGKVHWELCRKYRIDCMQK